MNQKNGNDTFSSHTGGGEFDNSKSSNSPSNYKYIRMNSRKSHNETSNYSSNLDMVSNNLIN